MINTKINFLPQIQDKLIEIGELLGRIKQLPSYKPTPNLRKESKIRTVFATTKIEGNELTYDEVTAIIDGKRIKGKKKDVLEVKNTLKLYDMISNLDPSSEMDFLLGHNVLMKGLIDNYGKYRDVNVGIKSNGKIKITFPEHKKIIKLCSDMFDYICNSTDNYIIKSCLVHYLAISIHPFEDGNGRISRFWQSLFLSKNHEIFEFLPIESLIKSNQKDYYEYLYLAQKSDEPTGFVDFMLKILIKSLKEGLKYPFESGESKQDLRLRLASEEFGDKEFTRKDYLDIHIGISPSLASKDLASFVNSGVINKRGMANGTRYFF